MKWFFIFVTKLVGLISAVKIVVLLSAAKASDSLTHAAIVVKRIVLMILVIVSF